MDCKRALQEADGDVEAATKALRAKGLADAGKRAGRDANEGIVDSYIHAGGKVGVMLEVNCETDFVARNEDFQAFVHDVALHVAAMKPLYVSADDVPEEFKAGEREVFTAQSQDIPEKAREKAIEGRLAKRIKEIALLDQEFVKDAGEKQARTIEDLRVEAASKMGENITIRRFVVYELGG